MHFLSLSNFLSNINLCYTFLYILKCQITLSPTPMTSVESFFVLLILAKNMCTWSGTHFVVSTDYPHPYSLDSCLFFSWGLFWGRLGVLCLRTTSLTWHFVCVVVFWWNEGDLIRLSHRDKAYIYQTINYPSSFHERIHQSTTVTYLAQ